MIKKLVIGGLIAIVVGAVGVGAYDAYRGNSSLELPGISVSQAAPSQGQGQGNGQDGQGQPQMQDREWQTLAGTVVSVDPQSIVVDTVEAGELTLQLGQPGFAAEQNVTFSPGDTVTIQGFEENGQFQAGQIDNESTGQKLLLRDPNGRPLWAGPGRQQAGGQGQNGGQGQGQGRRGQGSQGQGGPGQGSETGLPQAAAQEWVTLTGTVASAADQRNLVVQTADAAEISVELGPPWFAAGQSVAFNAGDALTLYGFWGDGGMFQAGEISNDTTGQKLLLRDPNGRPLWAGRGQGQQGKH